MNIEILDLGFNNISSVTRAINALNSGEDQVRVLTDGKESKIPDLLILPGLGHFGEAMSVMENRNFLSLIRQKNADRVPIVGICLGMQLFCRSSAEAEGSHGIDIYPGSVQSLPRPLFPPNVGWDSVEIRAHAEFFPSLKKPIDFYFTHSFYVEPDGYEFALGMSKFQNFEFMSALIHDNIVGFQFHPEKSGGAGRDLIRDVLEWARSFE